MGKPKNFFERIGNRTEKIVNKAYEGVGADRVVDRMKIAWNQLGIDRHQREAAKLKSQMDGFNSRMKVLDEGKKKIESMIKKLEQKKISKVVKESMESKIEEIKEQTDRLEADKNSADSEFQKRKEKIKSCTDERDRIADKFIKRYDGKLKPIQVELEGLKTSRDQVNFLITAAEIRHENKLAELNDIEKDRNEIADVLRLLGESEKQIRMDEAIKHLEREIRNGREKIRTEKEDLNIRKTQIKEDIERVEAKANSYREKKEKFARIIKGEGSTNEEIRNKTNSEEGGTAREKWGNDIEGVENNKQLTETYIKQWNNFLDGLSPGEKKQLTIEEDFLKEAKLENIKIDFEKFKNLLGKYMQYKKVPMNQFNESIDKFEEKVRGGKKA